MTWVEVVVVESGGVGRADVVAVGVACDALDDDGGVPCRAEAAVTEAGTSGGCPGIVDEPEGPIEDGPLSGCG